MVSFHAHPDDECIACGGVIRKASEEGHRVVLVVATRGERGEVPDGFLADGEELWQRRVAETNASAEILRALGAGLTDEAAARRLGTSLRTYRRVLVDFTRALRGIGST